MHRERYRHPLMSRSTRTGRRPHLQCNSDRYSPCRKRMAVVSGESYGFLMNFSNAGMMTVSNCSTQTLTACGATDHFPAYVPSKGDEVTCIQRSIWGASVEMAALLYVKKLMRHSIAPETSSAIRFASSRGFPAPNIFLITKLMLKEPT